MPTLQAAINFFSKSEEVKAKYGYCYSMYSAFTLILCKTSTKFDQ